MRRLCLACCALFYGLARADEPPPPLPAVQALPVEPSLVEPPIEEVEPEKPEKVHGPLGPNWGPDEYILWWLSPQQVPTLLARPTGPNGSQLTSIIGGKLTPQAHSGGRFFGGWSVDKEETIGFEWGYFFLGSRSRTLAAESAGGPGDPTLVRPFLIPGTGTPIYDVIAQPGVMAGGLELVASSRVQGFELNGVANLFASPCFHLDSLLGFRFLQVNEGLRIGARNSFASNGFYSVTDTVDQIDGHNQFFGGQMGLRLDFRHNRLFLDMTGKVALGQTNEVVKINGITVINSTGGMNTTSPYGFYSGPNNSGRFTNSTFAVLPEATVRVGIAKEKSRWFVGYNFMALSRLARPGDQIDLELGHRVVAIDAAQFVPPDRSRMEFKQSSFWAQGLMIGCEVRY